MDLLAKGFPRVLGLGPEMRGKLFVSTLTVPVILLLPRVVSIIVFKPTEDVLAR
jgi:hypothetical protein